ncbi:MAG: DUF4248 domain-containing protein [Bacteroidales bacterium]|nr:DUF4248 domain-containing protein [Bacteroidales bacterium]
MNLNRPILKRKLAQLYYPDHNPKTAHNRFLIEIRETPGLMKALSRQGYDPNVKKWYFTPAQIKVIVRYLKEP